MVALEYDFKIIVDLKNGKMPPKVLNGKCRFKGKSSLEKAFLLFATINCVTLIISLVACNVPEKDVSSLRDTPQPRLVLLFATCTVNRNYLSPYNPNISFTPHLDKFSQDAKVFTKHQTEAGLSGVAYASIFSGNQALRHGIFTHPTKLSEKIYTITEAFEDNNYETFFWNDHSMATIDLNYAQHTISKKQTFGCNLRKINDMRKRLHADDAKFQKILDTIVLDRKYKAFVMTNFSVTHRPYKRDRLKSFQDEYPEECNILRSISREEFDKYYELSKNNNTLFSYNFPQAVKNFDLTQDDIYKLSQVLDDIYKLSQILELLYKSNIAFLDELFGNLIAKINEAGILDECLIVFTADHGESLYKNHIPFKWSHGNSLQGDVLTVPLIIRSSNPAIHPGKVNFVTRSIDVFPTLAGLAKLHIPKEETMMGFDLSGVMMGSQPEPSLLAYSHSGMLPPTVSRRIEDIKFGYLRKFYPKADMKLTWVAIREGDIIWKYKKINGERFGFEAFDLLSDPMERYNILNSENLHHQEMIKKLEKYKADLVKREEYWEMFRNKEKMNLPESDAYKKLKSLDYL
jgi:arylsulfatase A-like enzyme